MKLSSILAPGFDWKFDDKEVPNLQLLVLITPEPGSLISAALPPRTFSGSVSTLVFLCALPLGVKMNENQDHTTLARVQGNVSQQY